MPSYQTDGPKGEKSTERIVVALDASKNSVAALRAAVELASMLGAELEGLFVEDINLMYLCKFPNQQEVGSYTGAVRRLDDRAMQRQLRALKATIRQTMAREAGRRPARSNPSGRTILRGRICSTGGKFSRPLSSKTTTRIEIGCGHLTRDSGGRLSLVGRESSQKPTRITCSNGGTILKSTDAGATWNILSSTGFGNVNKILIDPSDTTKMYCSIEGGGLYKSTNSGASWTLIDPGATNGYDVEFKPGDTNTSGAISVRTPSPRLQATRSSSCPSRADSLEASRQSAAARPIRCFPDHPPDDSERLG